jgi:RHS repeat-associated protein
VYSGRPRFDASRRLLWSATWGPALDQLIEWNTPAGRRIVLADAGTSVAAVWDPGSLRLSPRADYTPEGRATVRNVDGAITCHETAANGVCPYPAGMPFGWVSAWRSQRTGLVYLRNRWYSPLLGEFLSQDPTGYRDAYNLYAYGAMDPINNTDPLGLASRGLTGAGSGGRPDERWPDPTGRGARTDGGQGGGGRAVLAVPRTHGFLDRGGATLLAGISATSTGIGLLLLASGPIGWGVGLAAALALGGGIATIGLGIGHLTASHAGILTPEQSEELTLAGKLLAGTTTPGKLAGTIIGGAATGTVQGMLQGAEYGGEIGDLAEKAAALRPPTSAPVSRDEFRQRMRIGNAGQQMADYSLGNSPIGVPSSGKSALKDPVTGKARRQGPGQGQGPRYPDVGIQGEGGSVGTIEVKTPVGGSPIDPLEHARTSQQLKKERALLQQGPTTWNGRPVQPGEGPGVSTGWWIWKPPRDLQ